MQINLTDTDKQILSKHAASVRGRAFIELQIVNALIIAAVEKGYYYEIEDCEEDVADVTKLKLELFDRDDAVISVFNGKDCIGWIRLVFGNDGFDLVSDYSTTLEEFLKPVDKLARFLGQLKTKEAGLFLKKSPASFCPAHTYLQ